MFVALTFALSWLVAFPLWFGDGLASSWFYPVTLAMMATPGVAALVVVFFVERPRHKAWTLGLWPLTPVRRLLGYSVLGVLGSIALVLVALPVGALLGVYPADVVHFSAFRQLLDQQAGAGGVGELPVSTGVLVALQLAVLPLAAVINLVPALGEELGLLGAIFGWLRLRSGSVWPAALAHAALNGAAGAPLLFAEAGERVDTTQATILGWSGWIVPLALVAFLVVTGRFRPGRTTARPRE